MLVVGEQSGVFRHDRLHTPNDGGVGIVNQGDLHRAPSGAGHAVVARMKYVSLMLGLVAVYYFLVRSAPVKPVAEVVTAAEVVPLTTGPRETAAPAGTN